MAKYTEENMIKLLADRAERMLDAYAADPGVKERLRNMARKAAGRNVPERDAIFWPAGMLLLGLLEAGQVEACRAYVDAWIAGGQIVRHTDDALAGYVLVRLYEATGEQSYRDGADRIYQFLLDARTDSKGAIVYNAARENSYVFADGIGQTAMFLSHYGTVFDKPEALALAAMQISLFSQYGMDTATGLPYHAYEASSRSKLGIIGWGRAAGWILLGTSQYVADLAARQAIADAHGVTDGDEHVASDASLPATVRHMDCARDAVVVTYHNALVESVQRYVRKDGTYSWLLPASEGPQDSSASGMIAYSIVKALRANMAADATGADAATSVDGITSATGDAATTTNPDTTADDTAQTPASETENRIADMAAALSDFVNGDRVYSCSAECIDIGEYRQQYGCYPWGQGAVLAALAIS